MAGYSRKRLEAQMEQLGWTRYHTKVYFACGGAWASDYIWLMVLSYTMQSAGDEWGLSETERGLISTIFEIGMLFGSYFWGIAGDK